MTDSLTGGTSRQELVEVIRQVRSRWRTRLLLRGGIIVLAGGLLVLALASWGLQVYRFSPSSVTGFRVATLTILALLTGIWLVRPMRRRVSDIQVALYLEEHEPSLQAAILSAVDIGAAGGQTTTADVPPAIIDRMVEQAIARCRAVHGGRDVGKKIMQRYAVVFTSAIA